MYTIWYAGGKGKDIWSQEAPTFFSSIKDEENVSNVYKSTKSVVEKNLHLFEDKEIVAVTWPPVEEGQDIGGVRLLRLHIDPVQGVKVSNVIKAEKLLSIDDELSEEDLLI